jgi:transcriptional regulator with XRE-family HTH domain
MINRPAQLKGAMMTAKNPKTFSEVFIRLCASHPKGQIGVAEDTGLAQTSISDYCTGKSVPTARRVVLVAKLIGFDEKKLAKLADRDRCTDDTKRREVAEVIHGQVKKEKAKAANGRQ